MGLINNATEKIDGEYVLNLSEFDVNQIAVITSKPIAEGQLKINITKVINEEQDYSKEQMETFSLLRTSMAANTDMLGDIKSDEITLAEPVSRAELQLMVPSGNSDLSTAIEHENLELRVVLDTSSTSNALFKNPTLEIKFPKVMESIVVNDIQLANTEELEIANIEAQYNDDCNILYIELTGTQTEYTVGDALKGANIIINFNASLNMLSPSMEEQITLTYTNENTTLFEQTTSEGDKGLATTNVNIIAPTGVISASGMTGYSNTSEEVFTINNETITENIEVNSDSKTLTISGDIVNNYENDIANVKILGRLPFSGNKVIDEQIELGSTIDSVLLENISTSGIDTNNVEIYYSTNGEATNDVNSTSNGWTKTPSDLNTIKSYMIVINNNMGKGAHLHFSYNIEIPGELEFNSSAYTMYKVYYDNITELGNFKETKKSAILGVTTGAGPKLAVNLTASFPENAEIQEGRIVKFTATVTNEGEIEARAVKLTVPIPQGTQYVVMNTGSGGYEIVATGSNNPVLTTEQVFDLGNIKAGESIEQSYELKLLEDDEGLEDSNGRIEINHQVGATEVRMENPALSNTYKLYKVNGDIELEVVPKWEINRGLKTGDTVEFWVNFKNINKQNINNARIQTTLPEGIVVKEAKLMSNGDEVESQINTSNNKLQVTFDELIPNEKYNLLYQIEIQNYEGDFSTIFEAVGDGINTNYSNEIIYTVNDIDVSIVQTSDSPEYVKEGEEIVYNFVIKNNGNVETPILEFRNVVPDGLSFVKVESGLSNEKLTTNSTYGLKEITENIYYLEPGQEYIINLTLRANMLTSENTKRVENFATLDVGNISEQESNRIVNYIEYNPEAHGENPNNGRYIITGVAWNDANINGQRDDGEALLSGIEVMLINKNNNSIVLDSTTNQEKRSVTDTNGTYRFDNLTVGNYAVIFLYDSARYNITEYRKKDVRANLNSDALNVNLTYNGTLQKAGITDTIKITNSNMRNIDIGLYEAEKFDLSINKYVSKITLTTPTIGTQTYEYNNNVAKIEVLERNVGKSSIVIEYKIVVKNEGAIAGYARKIVDYLPESLTFNSELNSDWYQENDGNLYNTSLADVELQPGEQKELTLILTKKITEDSIGIINNSAEIFESYNEQGLQDMDSTPGNQVANEDDMSSADLVISLVTGKAALYIFIIVMVLGILITGSYLIKIKVIDVNKKKEE